MAGSAPDRGPPDPGEFDAHSTLAVPATAARVPTYPYQVGELILPGYRLEKRLGAGGFGEVWRATAPGGMGVAIKILANLGRVQGGREYRALQTIKNIRHAHIVPLFGVWLKSGDGRVLGEHELVEAERIVVNAKTNRTRVRNAAESLVVHEAVADEFLDRFAAAVGALVTGDPADPATNVSALISTSETDRVAECVDAATAAGATAVVGGERAEHGVLRPTILDGVTDDMTVCRTEVFGPVVGVQRYTDVQAAFASANDSRYGLQAGIFTADLSLGLEAAHRLDYGGVCVNEVPTFRADQMPYGGIKDSGNTKEGPAWAVREMTEERMVVIQR